MQEPGELSEVGARQVVTRTGRGGRIRTCDLLHPRQTRCQAAPRPDFLLDSTVSRTSRFSRPGDLGGSLSYKIIYSGFLEVVRNGRICLILLVGAARFELATPCAQGSFKPARKCPIFNSLRFKQLQRAY